MKISHVISGLHNSTKATVIACSVLLAITAVVLFFLMLYPIEARDKSAALSAPVIMETTTTSSVRETTTTKEPPHTLSTWEVPVETVETAYDPDATTDIPWYDKLFTTVQKETDTPGNADEQITTVPEEVQQPEVIQPEEITEPITMPEPVTEPPAQTITEVVVTEPEPTAPPVSEGEIVNADPVAPAFSNT